MRLPRTLTSIVFILFLLFWPALVHADFQAGLNAYARGDYATAFKEWLPLAEQGEALAQLVLGGLYEYGRGVPQDYAQAAAWYRQAAERGDVRAQVNLGRLYMEGQGVPQDYAQAADLFRKAAEQGLAIAQFGLGFLYQEGHGVPQDWRKARGWWLKVVVS